MSEGLVLSLFPGLGMLDEAFIREGFTVVRGPDPLWGGDVRAFHPPSGVFEGVIGGPPCQAFSALSNLVRAKGLEPRFGNLIPEYERCIRGTQPRWFLMENVREAPLPVVDHYDVTDFLLDNCWLGEAQMRKRRFSFGYPDEAPNLRRWIPGVALELPDTVNAVCADPRSSFIPGGQAEVDALRSKQTAVGGSDGWIRSGRLTKTETITGRHTSSELRDGKGWSAPQPKRTIEEMLELQGFPPDWCDHQPWTKVALRKMIGNGVPLPMGRAVARAIVKATASGSGW